MNIRKKLYAVAVGHYLIQLQITENVKDGLTKDYALSYSMNITEPFVMMVPRMYGGSSDHVEVREEKSKAIEKLRALST